MAEARNEAVEAPGPVAAASARSLIVRHRDGDTSAFAELIMIFRAPVYSYITRCGVAPATRDDLFQEVFIKVHTAARSYKADLPFEPWLFTIVANTVRSHYRKQVLQEKVFAADQEPVEQAEYITGENLQEARETAEWLEQELTKLPFSQREVVVLCCMKDLSLKDVAGILDLPLNTIKTHLRRGKLVLAKALVSRSQAASEEVPA